MGDGGGDGVSECAGGGNGWDVWDGNFLSIHDGADLVGVDRLRKDRDFVDIRPGHRRLEDERPIRRNRQAVAAVVLQDYARVSDEPGNHPTDCGADWISGACDGDGDVSSGSAAARGRVDGATLRRIAGLCLNGYRVRAVLGDGGRERKGAGRGDRKFIRGIVRQNEPGTRKPADRYAYRIGAAAPSTCRSACRAATGEEKNRSYQEGYKKREFQWGFHKRFITPSTGLRRASCGALSKNLASPTFVPGNRLGTIEQAMRMKTRLPQKRQIASKARTFLGYGKVGHRINMRLR